MVPKLKLNRLPIDYEIAGELLRDNNAAAPQCDVIEPVYK